MKTYFKLIDGHTYDVMSRNPKPAWRYQFQLTKGKSNVVAVDRMDDIHYFRQQPKRLAECDPDGNTLTHKGGPVPTGPGGPHKRPVPGQALTSEIFKDPRLPAGPPPRPTVAPVPPPAPEATVEVTERLTKEALEGMERDEVLVLAEKAGVSNKGNTKTVIGRILKAQDE